MAMIKVLVQRSATSITEQSVMVDTDQMLARGFSEGQVKEYIEAGLATDQEGDERTISREDEIIDITRVYL